MTTAQTGNRRKAVDNGDPVALIERALYRTQRQLDSPGPVSTERIRTGHNRADLTRALELLTSER